VFSPTCFRADRDHEDVCPFFIITIASADPEREKKKEEKKKREREREESEPAPRTLAATTSGAKRILRKKRRVVFFLLLFSFPPFFFFLLFFERLCCARYQANRLALVDLAHNVPLIIEARSFLFRANNIVDCARETYSKQYRKPVCLGQKMREQASDLSAKCDTAMRYHLGRFGTCWREIHDRLRILFREALGRKTKMLRKNTLSSCQ